MIAKGLAENGAKVYIVGRRFEVVKQASEQDINGSGQLIPLVIMAIAALRLLNMYSKAYKWMSPIKLVF